MTGALLAALALVQAAPAATLPPEVDPRIPSREAHTIEASCRGRAILVRFAVNRPGPDLFLAMSIAGTDLPQTRIEELNRMLGGYMLDRVQLYSCEGEGAAYELKLNLFFSRGEERHIYLVGIRDNRLRIIR